MAKNKEGMRYPSIDKLLNKIDSKYKLVYAASRVSEILEKKKLVVRDAKCEKSVGIALEEILNNRVEVEFDK